MTSLGRMPIWTIAICLSLMALFAAIEISFWPSLRVLFGPDRVRHTYYIPSESMLPTLEVDDRVVPRRITPNGLRRGMIVVFSTPSGTRVARVAGLPGDTVALDSGIVSIDDKPVAQHPLGAGPTLSDGEATRSAVEQFPGETHLHRILDAGQSIIDDMARLRVPDGDIFVLGDDRDRAADSRLPAEEGGVSMVPIDTVIGEIDTVMWSHDRARIGKPIDAPIVAGTNAVK